MEDILPDNQFIANKMLEFVKYDNITPAMPDDMKWVIRHAKFAAEVRGGIELTVRDMLLALRITGFSLMRLQINILWFETVWLPNSTIRTDTEPISTTLQDNPDEKADETKVNKKKRKPIKRAYWNKRKPKK